MEELIKPSTVKKTLKIKTKINYDNGANETIYPIKPPNVSPVTPMFMDFLIKIGTVRHVNLTKVRSMDMEVTEEISTNLTI